MLHVFALEKLDNVALHKRRMTNLRTIFSTQRVLNWAIVAEFFGFRAAQRRRNEELNYVLPRRVHEHKEWMSDKMWKQ